MIKAILWNNDQCYFQEELQEKEKVNFLLTFTFFSF